MISFEEVTTLEQLEQHMGLFFEGYGAMEKKHKVFEVDWEGFVKTLVGVVNTVPKNGILVMLEDGEPIGYGVAFDDTPPYSLSRTLLLWALYVKTSYSKWAAPQLFDRACELAKEQGYDEVKAFNSRFSGASFRFFEQVLGMHRNKIQFIKTL